MLCGTGGRGGERKVGWKGRAVGLADIREGCEGDVAGAAGLWCGALIRRYMEMGLVCGNGLNFRTTISI